ncbi:MAG: amidohydrolase [Bacillota bacterium]
MPKELKNYLFEAIDDLWDDIWGTALHIHNNPELGGQEYKAVEQLTRVLDKHGFKCKTPYLGVETSFLASLGEDKPRIFFLAEYDALPGLGHGCGHNLIAGAGLGAAISLAGLKEHWSGSIAVLGTPAEETNGAKVHLLEKGAFANCDAALIFHPGQSAVINITSQALEALEVVFLGFHGHSSRGERGNPLISLVNLYQETLNYRKAYYPEAQIDGVITNGGSTPNLIPDKTIGKFYIRAMNTHILKRTIQDFKEIVDRIASRNKTEAFIQPFEPRYLPMNTNLVLAHVFKEQVKLQGVKMDMNYQQIIGSMDMGNVSWEVPSIHPYLPLGKGKFSAHSQEFMHLAGSREGEKTLKIATKALAATALELLTDDGLLERVWREHMKSG